MHLCSINPIIMSRNYNTKKKMRMCINVLVQIYTSAYFNMGLLMKALEIIWAKPMYLQYIFPCGGGMYLLTADFASIGYIMVKWDSENCHLNLSLSAVCDCGVFCSISLTIFDVSAVGSVKQNLSGKEYDKALL